MFTDYNILPTDYKLPTNEGSRLKYVILWYSFDFDLEFVVSVNKKEKQINGNTVEGIYLALGTW